MTDDKAVSILLHKYGALSFWDYAAAAPYVPIDMNPFVLGYVTLLLKNTWMVININLIQSAYFSYCILYKKNALIENPSIYFKLTQDLQDRKIYFVLMT